MPLDIDPGKAAVGNPRLIERIVAEMNGAPIPFERFMEFALYEPEFGYYRKPGRIGTQGDFLTSPAVHPMFGWTVAAWCRWVWEAIGRPDSFTIFEPGAGEGHLARAILDWAEGRDDGFRDALRYVAIEPNSAGTDKRVDWATPPIEPVPHGVVVTNELFDALPVRLFEAEARGPVEIHVAWDGKGFVEVRGGIASIDGAPPAGRFEVSPRAYPTMQALCGLIQEGAVLTFDYGYPQEELWAPWRTGGTLLCFYRHTSHENPYIHVGEQDLTAHVNLTDLEAAADHAGFAIHGLVSQADFLVAAGMANLVEAVRDDMAEYFARRRALHQLIDTAGLGRIRVLAATRGFDAQPPGFEVQQ